MDSNISWSNIWERMTAHFSLGDSLSTDLIIGETLN